MNFIKKIIKKRWHLHIIVGAIFGLMLLGAFSLLGFYDSTRWWEEMAIQLVFGTVFKTTLQQFITGNWRYFTNYKFFQRIK